MDVALFEWEDFSPTSAAAPPDRARDSVLTKVRRPWLGKLAVFDLETTGIDVRTSRIVTAHVGILDGTGECMERRDWLADPGVEIPEAASAIHGVSTARARAHGRPAVQVVTEVVEALERVFTAGLPVVVYNAPYDFSLLRHEARRYGVPALDDPKPVIDPLVLDRQMDRYRKGKRTLAVTAAHYGVDLLEAHEAASDAIAAGRVAQAIAARYPELAVSDAEDLHRWQSDWYRIHADDFELYMRSTRDSTFQAERAWPIA